jgi:hypothetical protein
MLEPAEALIYRGPIAVTVAYFCLWYYLLLGLQRGTKYKLKDEYAAKGQEFDRYFGQDPRMLAADRAVINTQEQMVPFLVSLWLHAVFVSPSHAAYLGLAYVVLRSLYPVLLGKSLSKTQSKRVFFVTGPAYCIVFYLLGKVLYAAVTG